jgi:hypothetical protein
VATFGRGDFYERRKRKNRASYSAAFVNSLISDDPRAEKFRRNYYHPLEFNCKLFFKMFPKTI